jgi:hypothetical protein
MRSITVRCVARAFAAALLMAAFATSAHAATAGDGNGGHAAAPAAPGHASAPDTEPLRYGDPGTTADCGAGLVLSAPPATGDAGDAVKALSRATQRYISQCRCVTQKCIADALDKYAQALAAIAPRLPPELRDTPNIVAQAAHRVRAARTKAQAVQVLDQAIADVTKRISYIRADDPETQRRETRGGDFVVETLNAASLSLEKAGGL